MPYDANKFVRLLLPQNIFQISELNAFNVTDIFSRRLRGHLGPSRIKWINFSARLETGLCLLVRRKLSYHANRKVDRLFDKPEISESIQGPAETRF